MEENKKRGRGRPTKFTAELSETVRKLGKLGCTDVEIAHSLGVCEKTIDVWKKKHPEFLQSLNSGKSEADNEVVESLFKRAKGTDEHPGDTTACIFWLKNRQRDRWRDKQEVEHGGIVTIAGLPESVLIGAREYARNAAKSKKP